MAAAFPAYNPLPLRRCLQVAEAAGAVAVIVEPRYIDLDYRSEFSAFYSKAFHAYPGTTARLHFFATAPEGMRLWELPPESVAAYRGYMVLRPSAHGRVGRTMLAPPADLMGGIRTAVTESVHLFGQDLSITAVPFVEQDTQIGRCAHAAAWICHYSAHRRGEVGRRPMASFGLSARLSLSDARALPSGGLNVAQIVELMNDFGLPAVPFSRKSLPPPTASVLDGSAGPPGTEIGQTPEVGMLSVACRFLNSGIPVLVGAQNHAFVLCGYLRSPREAKPDWIRLIRHDDQVGPYLIVDDVAADIHPTGRTLSPWHSLVVPLPEKVWLAAEDAEVHGAKFLISLAENAATESPPAEALVKRYQTDRAIAFRTYVIDASTFKRDALGRLDDVLVEAYRMAAMPHYIWVVEAVDRDLRRAGQKECVLGEVILDSTSSRWDPKWLARHVPSLAVLAKSDGTRMSVVCSSEPYRSGGAGAP